MHVRRDVAEMQVHSKGNFMSDIPLRKLRRHKNRGDYTPLDDQAESARIALHSPAPNTDMTRATHIASAAARRNRGRDIDDPDEEERLLDNTDHSDEQSERPVSNGGHLIQFCY